MLAGTLQTRRGEMSEVQIKILPHVNVSWNMIYWLKLVRCLFWLIEGACYRPQGSLNPSNFFSLCLGLQSLYIIPPELLVDCAEKFARAC